MKHFLVVANGTMEQAGNCIERITRLVEEHGAVCNTVMIDKFSSLGEKVKPYVGTGIDAILVLGGDGTLIRCAGILRTLQIPLIGINIGNMGYLCEV